MPVDASKSIMPAWLPAFNRRVTNRVQGIYAPYLPPLAVIVHVGRNSGRVYTSPVAAQIYAGKVAIPLPYSAEAQWVRNLVAADGGEMIRRGKRFAVSNPRVLLGAAAEESLPPLIARALQRMPVLVADLAPAAGGAPAASTA
jgi:deazaflavin-dependent oxidoreductase (nitroreductase family)